MIRSLLTIFGAFFGICQFRLAPQDLPASRDFLVLTMLAYTLASIVLTRATEPIAEAVMAGVLESLLLLLFTYLVLTLRGLVTRWLQTCTAMAGAGLVFSVIAMPLFYSLDISAGASPSPLPYLLILVLIIWNISVLAHILRHALSSSMAIGVVAALGYIWLVTFAVGWILAAQPTA